MFQHFTICRKRDLNELVLARVLASKDFMLEILLASMVSGKLGKIVNAPSSGERPNSTNCITKEYQK